MAKGNVAEGHSRRVRAIGIRSRSIGVLTRRVPCRRLATVSHFLFPSSRLLMDGRRTGQTRVRMRSVEAGKSTSRIDLLATEEPMEMRMRYGSDIRPIAVTMRTPGIRLRAGGRIPLRRGADSFPRRDRADRVLPGVRRSGAAVQHCDGGVEGQRAKGKGQRGNGHGHWPRHWALGTGHWGTTPPDWERGLRAEKLPSPVRERGWG